MIEITPADLIRLRALGVRADADLAAPPSREEQMAQRCEAYRNAMLLAIESERRAWREARRWRMWGWFGLACAAASIAAALIAAIARRGGW
jgi:hypothetical protein